jgi:hypothetical protein
MGDRWADPEPYKVQFRWADAGGTETEAFESAESAQSFVHDLESRALESNREIVIKTRIKVRS